MNCKTQIKDEYGLYCSQIGTFILFLSVSLIISNEERFNRDIQQQSNIFKDKPKSKNSSRRITLFYLICRIR